MKDQVHIRSAEAASLARALARQTGKTIGDVVLDALRQYWPSRRTPMPARRVEHWRSLLQDDRKQRTSDTPLECLYDDATGLPA